jgi:hypothetical protein
VLLLQIHESRKECFREILRVLCGYNTDLEDKIEGRIDEDPEPGMNETKYSYRFSKLILSDENQR